MEDKLDFVVLQTNTVMSITILDISTYNDISTVTNPKVKITIPSFGEVERPFIPQTYNVYNSTNLGITVLGKEVSLPDGVYKIQYGVDPFDTTCKEHSIMKVDKLQEKFDKAFLTLDMMECDSAIKKQSIVQLNTIYMFIQGSIASANNCSYVDADRLYKEASRLLDNFIKQDCGCGGTNYLINY